MQKDKIFIVLVLKLQFTFLSKLLTGKYKWFVVHWSFSMIQLKSIKIHTVLPLQQCHSHLLALEWRANTMASCGSSKKPALWREDGQKMEWWRVSKRRVLPQGLNVPSESVAASILGQCSKWECYCTPTLLFICLFLFAWWHLSLIKVKDEWL